MNDTVKWFLWVIGIFFIIMLFSGVFNRNNDYYDYSKFNNNYNTENNYTNNNTAKITEPKTIYNPTFMDEKCQKRFPWTKYNKNTDKCECFENKNFNENLNSCPLGSQYENIIWTNVEFDYCDESWFALPINAHCTPFDGNKRWDCDYWYYQSKWQWQFSGQTVCVNKKTYEYYWLITCERSYFFETDEEWNQLKRYKCIPNSERALKNNYEKVSIY